MNKYRIIYFDDDASDIRNFKRKAKSDFEIINIPLKEDIDELIMDILDSKVHALIVDHSLNERDKKITYTGIEVLDKLENYLEDFPSFILTSYEDTAENNIGDVNKIYEKENYLEEPSKLNRRILKQIEHYNKKLNNTKLELMKLSEKRKASKLSLEEEEKLIELDDFLERSIFKKGIIEKELKKTSNEEKLNELIKKADLIINKIK